MNDVLTLAEVRNLKDSLLFSYLTEAKRYASSQMDAAPAYAKAARLLQEEIDRREI
jgi:hypothetical protein